MTEMIVTVANAERVGAEILADVLQPPPPVDYLHWAVENIEFSKRESQFAGPYNRELFGYFDEILRALSPDDPCRIVTLMKSAQLGGTVLANIFVGGSIDMDPGDVLYVHPTEGNAQRWSKTKLAPMLKGTTALAKLFPMKSRDGADSVLYKERVDGKGAIIIGGANSPASLSMITVSRQVQDDLSKWEMNTAGDPEVQADSRSRGREDAKIFKISTPLVEPGCRITENYKQGSQERLHVPCPHCGHMQVLEWENFAANIDEAHPENAHFVCADPECGGVIEEYHRGQMIAGHEWRADNPSAKRFHRSFELWSAISLLQSFERVAREWIGAKGDPAAEQVFFNDTVGRAYRTLGEAPGWEALRDRAAESTYDRGHIPAGFLIVTCGIDCQQDRVEWQVLAFGRDRKRAIVDYGVFPGHISEERCQLALNGLLTQTWPNAFGRRIGLDLTGIDGNAFTEDVWDWVKKHPTSRVIMLRGVGSEAAPLLARVKRERDKQGKLVKWSRRFYNFAASVMKMGLYRNLVKTDPMQRGYVALPRGLEDEFFRQLTAESRKPERNKKTGFVSYKWVKAPEQANEGLDTHLQAEATAIKFGVRSLPDALWDRYEAERESAPDPVQGDIEDLFNAVDAAPAADRQEGEQPKDNARSVASAREKYRKRMR
ncbi:phage terminase large subunit family protein [Paradevosia shaoguanensis]|uniref:Phage terminase large subunit family protein n=1 Tax=Paradevosia shaoguanensis TaxID=1335043 RepID=A0AA41UCX0_9HYPH|nr:terminase gpA endonuclease subunit [Paradevosia shaoguanensis]MCF1744214.1 phage terminase large subunit family protein [Paradevosia shaoguanensis]MCI0128697.1 phage terminase large subunit family protein [Paradevosia shaoguanensis]